MAARRLVLNGLTAEVGAAATPAPDSPDSLEFYHELELYRQLMALPPHVTTPLAAPRAAPQATPRRARTPDPAPSTKCHDEVPRRSRTPGCNGRRAPSAPAAPSAAPAPTLPQARPAKYLGSFPVEGSDAGSAGGEEAARAHVSAQLQLMKESGRAVPVLVVVALSGVKVCDPEDQSVRMRHALRRILYATCEAPRALFALVAREPRAAPTVSEAPAAPAAPAASDPQRHYCHAFHTDTPEQAEELNTLVGDAFRMAFASQLQPSAPLWSKELNSSECGVGVRAPDSLPGLSNHYPHCVNRSPAKCNIMGMTKLVNELSPSSSEESNSPTEINCYRRLGERQPLMKRLAMGLSGALLQPSDDDSTPLVADTPTTPTNVPLCMNGGYINEASEAEARTRESNREHTSVPPTPRRDENFHHGDLNLHFRRTNNAKNNSPSVACSHTTSSSSGTSSCGGGGGGGGVGGGAGCGGSSCSSGNNNVPRAEPELRYAPWFQQGIPREIALEVLSRQPVGAFLVRGSTTQAGCWALSVRVPRGFAPRGIAHYLILPTPKGYKIKGFTKEFRSLSALVTHHSVMPELLPAPLLLQRGARAPPRPDHADIDAVAPPPRPHPHRPGFLAQLDV